MIFSSYILLFFILKCVGIIYDPSPGEYALIREKLILQEPYEKKITSLNEVSKTALFYNLIEDKIFYISPNALHFAYASEGVNDTEWGCAWRAIQTSLSSHYDGDVDRVPTFSSLYQDYGKRTFLMRELENGGYEAPNKEWKAPHENWHMWADPIIGHLIMQDLGIDSKLVVLNQPPDSYSPVIYDEKVSFSILKEKLIHHFRHGGYPVIIDNGKFALSILGVGERSGSLFLLIGDPHLIPERDNNLLNGLYVVKINRTGRQVSIAYPALHNHFDNESYESLEFTAETKWSILFAQPKRLSN